MLGWKPDIPDARDWRASALFAAEREDVPVLFDTPDLTRFRGPRYYQWNVGSCVAFAVKRAVRMCHAIAYALARTVDLRTREPDELSALFVYWNARRAEWAGEEPWKVPPPEDDGCRPRLAVKVVRDLGFCREVDWPYGTEPERVRAQPPPKAYRRAIDQAGLTFHRVFETGPARLPIVRAALRAGYVPIFGWDVDDTYMRHTGETPVRFYDPRKRRGGHMQAILTMEAGDEIIADNWWQGWGRDDGTVRIAPELFISTVVQDLLLIKTVPTFA